jgi:transposase
MNAPEIGQTVKAQTTTSTAQQVVVLITYIEEETEKGWIVYGYRKGGRNAGRRQTMVPRMYFVPKG